MPTVPTPITPYSGIPPSSADPANFDARADAKVAEDAAKIVEFNALGENAYDNALEAYNSALNAGTQRTAAETAALAAASNASAAAASAGAVLWVSGTTYAVGFRAWSPINQRVYRRKTAGAGTTDPSADPTNWAFLSGQRPVYRPVTGTSTTAAVGEWLGLANASLTTVTAPASPSVDDEFWVSPENGRNDNKIARNSQLIMGLAEDIDIGSRDETVRLVFVGGSIGWRLLDV